MNRKELDTPTSYPEIHAQIAALEKARTTVQGLDGPMEAALKVDPRTHKTLWMIREIGGRRKVFIRGLDMLTQTLKEGLAE